jgi:hypothetical protein
MHPQAVVLHLPSHFSNIWNILKLIVMLSSYACVSTHFTAQNYFEHLTKHNCNQIMIVYTCMAWQLPGRNNGLQVNGKGSEGGGGERVASKQV